MQISSKIDVLLSIGLTRYFEKLFRMNSCFWYLKHKHFWRIFENVALSLGAKRRNVEIHKINNKQTITGRTFVYVQAFWNFDFYYVPITCNLIGIPWWINIFLEVIESGMFYLKDLSFLQFVFLFSGLSSLFSLATFW